MIQEIKTLSHEEWVVLRNKTIGGSDAGAIAGLNPYQSAYSLWAEKTGKVPPFEGNLKTEVGTYLEDFVAKLFERETGKKVRRRNSTVYNGDYPWAHANVDRVIVGENAVLEIKTTSNLTHKKILEGGEIPDIWYCQITHYMAVCGYRKAYLAVLIDNSVFKWFELSYDESEAAALMQLEEVFFKHMQEGTPPPVSGMECDTETISIIYANSTEGSVDLWGRDAMMDEFFSIGEQIDALKARRNLIQQQICSDMGECDTGTSNKYRVTWKTQQRRTFDHKRFAAEHPEIDMSSYYRVSTSRPFKIKAL